MNKQGSPIMRVLVLEDEYLLASDIARSLQTLGAEVVGPFRSTEEAFEGLAVATAAILDVRIAADTSFPVADYLQNRQMPFVFYTGVPDLVPERFATVQTFGKPTPVGTILNSLQHQEIRRISVAPETDVFELLPALRHRARQLMGDLESADRLVEATLMAAIHTESERRDVTLESWLLRVLHLTYRRSGRDMLS